MRFKAADSIGKHAVSCIYMCTIDENNNLHLKKIKTAFKVCDFVEVSQL
jgi:hypothetical protein